MNRGWPDNVLRGVSWIAGSFALLFAVLLGSHVLGHTLSYDPRRPVFALEDVYWALATAAMCLAVVVMTRALRSRAQAARAGIRHE